jgi:hypothetical protein
LGEVLHTKLLESVTSDDLHFIAVGGKMPRDCKVCEKPGDQRKVGMADEQVIAPLGAAIDNPKESIPLLTLDSRSRLTATHAPKFFKLFPSGYEHRARGSKATNNVLRCRCQVSSCEQVRVEPGSRLLVVDRCEIDFVETDQLAVG